MLNLLNHIANAITYYTENMVLICGVRFFKWKHFWMLLGLAYGCDKGLSRKKQVRWDKTV